MSVMHHLSDGLTEEISALPLRLQEVVVFGAGSLGRRVREALFRSGVDVRCFCDNDPDKHGRLIDGIPVIPPSRLTDFPGRSIVIASMYHKAIAEQLADLGYGGLTLVGGEECLRTRFAPEEDSSPWSRRAWLESLLRTQSPAAVFSCVVNGLALLVPVEVLRRYPECLRPTTENPFTYYLETAQSTWLCSRLRTGDAAFDVGASAGLLSAAMALAVGHTGIVHAFEPARASYDLLARMLNLNQIAQVKPVRLALADRIGAADFVEYGSNNELSWAADASRLLSPGQISQNDYAVYSVPIETLDAYVTRQEVFPGVIKIDIEGFEMDALRGGRCLLESTKPALCIDIHHDPRTGESTGPEVEGFLHGLGYKTRRERHALYAEHPQPCGAGQ